MDLYQEMIIKSLIPQKELSYYYLIILLIQNASVRDGYMNENDSLLVNNNQVLDLSIIFCFLINIDSDEIIFIFLMFFFYYQKERVKDEDMDELFLLNNNQVFVYFVVYAFSQTYTLKYDIKVKLKFLNW